MLNKELMLIPKAGKDYTHIVTVASAGPRMIGYGDGEGDIEPKELDLTSIGADVFTIFELVSNSMTKSTTVRVGSFLGINVGQVFLGRADTKAMLGTNSTVRETAGWTSWEGELFEYDEVGKQVPIWLATTPMVVTSCSSSNSSNFWRVA